MRVDGWSPRPARGGSFAGALGLVAAASPPRTAWWPSGVAGGVRGVFAASPSAAGTASAGTLAAGGVSAASASLASTSAALVSSARAAAGGAAGAAAAGFFFGLGFAVPFG